MIGMVKMTVITICYNEKERVTRTIESVCHQSYPNIEYFIIDGASSDGTDEVLKKYSGYKNVKIFSEEDYGIYNAMNRGIARASGDYLLFLNAGDWFYDNEVLEKVAAYVIKDMHAIYYGNICSIFADGSSALADQSNQAILSQLFEGEMPCHQSIFAPRSTLVNHYFREDYRIRADYEWLVYSVSRQVKCVHMPVVISCYDMAGSSGLAANRRQFQKETQTILKEYEENFGKENLLDLKDVSLIKWKNLSDKHFLMYQLINYWLSLKQKGKCFAPYFQKKGYYRVAVYGMGYLGQRVVDEFRNSDIIVEYAIDQNAQKFNLDIPVFHPEEELREVDVVVVTTITCFHEIKKRISEKITCNIVSLEDIIYGLLSGEREA